VGFNRRIVPSIESYQISAIFDAIFAARDIDLSGTAIFSTNFPEVEDIKLIVATGIKTLYFYGKIDNAESTNLLNNLDKNINPLEVWMLD
jgi:hypothetical protein